jgi:hypothetical protein
MATLRITLDDRATYASFGKGKITNSRLIADNLVIHFDEAGLATGMDLLEVFQDVLFQKPRHINILDGQITGESNG